MKIVIRSRKAIEKMSKIPFPKGTALISITDASDSPMFYSIISHFSSYRTLVRIILRYIHV